jgi:hypothetical protein
MASWGEKIRSQLAFVREWPFSTSSFGTASVIARAGTISSCGNTGFGRPSLPSYLLSNHFYPLSTVDLVTPQVGFLKVGEQNTFSVKRADL